MNKTLAATGFFLIGLALVGAGIAACFVGKPVGVVIAFVAVGISVTTLCSMQKKDA